MASLGTLLCFLFYLIGGYMLKSIKIWIKEYEEKLNYAENVLEYNATENRLNELKKLAKKGIKYLSLSQVNRLF